MSRVRSTHLVCTGCRVLVKQSMQRVWERPCPRCDAPMRDAGSNLEVPRRTDSDGWRALTAVLDSGLTFHSTCECCQDGPGYRPRTAAEIRRRLRHARRTGITAAQALARPDTEP